MTVIILVIIIIIIIIIIVVVIVRVQNFQHGEKTLGLLPACNYRISATLYTHYRGAVKSLARPGNKQATATKL